MELEKPFVGGNVRFGNSPIWLWVTNRYPKWNPGKWKHGPNSAVPCWFNFEPHPFGFPVKFQGVYFLIFGYHDKALSV